MKLNGKKIVTAFPCFEHIVIVFENDDKTRDDFFIKGEDLAKALKNANFTIEKKRTRNWGIPIKKRKPKTFDFNKFRDFLLYEPNCSAEDIDLITEWVGKFLENEK